MFTDWEYNTDIVNTDFQDAIDFGGIRSYKVINDEKEFIWAIKGTSQGSNDYIEYRYNKTDGMLLYLLWDLSLNLSLDKRDVYLDSFVIVRQKGYVRPNESIFASSQSNLNSEIIKSSNSPPSVTTSTPTISTPSETEDLGSIEPSNDSALSGFLIFQSFVLYNPAM